MGDVAEHPVLALLVWHGHKKSFIAFNYFSSKIEDIENDLLTIYQTNECLYSDTFTSLLHQELKDIGTEYYQFLLSHPELIVLLLHLLNLP